MNFLHGGKMTDEQSSKIMRSVTNIVNFIKSNSTNTLFEAKNRGLIDVNDDQLQKICNLLETSITNAYVKSSNDLTSTMRSFTK
jgi:hypothetical protein